METCPHHEALAKDVKETKFIVEKIYNKLFVDNGTESLQTFKVKTTNWIEQHDKQIINNDVRSDKNYEWLKWAICIAVSFGIVILDKLWK